MDGSPRIATTYEVLLFADMGTRLGIERRWLIAGSHASRRGATAQYEELNREFPHPRVKLLLVAAVHDAATGLFRDRVLESRGAAPLIQRKQMQRLGAGERAKLAAALGPPPAARSIRPPTPPPRRAGLGVGTWVLGLALLAGFGAAVLLR
ncbi:hypothetical protein [Paracraurococcus lichenis]|uniref:Uncharacterized protein n=1 Tax=Paracraurococcus lichenis TaxID=3064888 RepID=A0ABT9E7P8_9PROT|nr:hypothetical protein [Paracraurococcus sp. LOR1-02]MDO9712154.1 hypothetical protein [Paracraurococcus sp. LOR1-02]